jgi:hypothetical protein
MSRLRISLPDELRHDRRGTERRPGAETTSRRLGSGIEGADDTSRKIIRWLDCWAKLEG